jgi:hypothetical protein
MPTGQLLVDAIDAALAPAGFKLQNKRKTWYRPEKHTLLMVNLQKSDFGGQYYINLGVSLKSLAEDQWPPIHHCHIGRRLNTLAPDRSGLKVALDLECPHMNDKQRIQVVSSCMEEFALPFLFKLISIEGIKEALTERRLPGAAVMLAVYDQCGLPRPNK